MNESMVLADWLAARCTICQDGIRVGEVLLSGHLSDNVLAAQESTVGGG